MYTLKYYYNIIKKVYLYAKSKVVDSYSAYLFIPYIIKIWYDILWM